MDTGATIVRLADCSPPLGLNAVPGLICEVTCPANFSRYNTATRLLHGPVQTAPGPSSGPMFDDEAMSVEGPREQMALILPSFAFFFCLTARAQKNRWPADDDEQVSFTLLLLLFLLSLRPTPHRLLKRPRTLCISTLHISILIPGFGARRPRRPITKPAPRPRLNKGNKTDGKSKWPATTGRLILVPHENSRVRQVFAA